MKKWYFFLSRGKDVEFDDFQEKLFSTPKMLKMWKTRGGQGRESLENRENPKSSPQRFPHFPIIFVGNLKKPKNVRFAQIFLLLAEKWKKRTVRKWQFWQNFQPFMEKYNVKISYLFCPFFYARHQTQIFWTVCVRRGIFSRP